jgi:hypothetical protein
MLIIMNQNRMKKLCELALESRKLTIVEFRMLPTNTFDNEKNEWVPDSYSLFLTLKRKENLDGSPESTNVVMMLESLFGFECCVDYT